ncbi:MAG: chemotaxis protein CheX [Eubacteriales bacterium]|nr:chemotaxis protein CheX [Eubacteriales bacterium]
MNVNHINPFLQCSISVMKSVTQIDLTVGHPEKTDFKLKNRMYAIQVGVVGEMRGQVVLAMEEKIALEVASRMMFGMQVTEIDEMSASALNELSNMIMGNTATVFSTQGILIDITPPIAICGDGIQMHSDIDGIRVPLLKDGVEYMSLYICIFKE